MNPKLTLYDLADKENKPFSPSTWLVRLALNYKGLPFKTVWLHFVDIKPTLMGLGVTPNNPNGFYTVPVLVDSSDPGSPIVLVDSVPIARYLDTKYPARPIFPEGTKALLAMFSEHMLQIAWLIVPILAPLTLPHLAECDKGYFRETRERFLGAKLEVISPVGPKRDGQLEKLRKALDDLAKLLSMNGEGMDFVLGDQVSVGDFHIVALFAWLAKIDPDSWESMKAWNEGRWERFWRRSEGWRHNQA